MTVVQYNITGNLYKKVRIRNITCYSKYNNNVCLYSAAIKG